MSKSNHFILFVLFGFFGCKHPVEKIQPCNIEEVHYYKDVKPIIQNNCAVSGCHNSTNGIGNFNSYDELSVVLDNGEFQRRIFWRKDMPPFPMDTCEFLTLRKWYNEGHQKN